MLKHWKYCGLAVIWSSLLVAVSASAVNDVILFPRGLTITMTDYLALRDVVIDPEQWVRDAVKGKIANSKHRMREGWSQRKPDLALPRNDSLMVEIVVGQPDYKNRAERDSIEARTR